MVVFAMIDIPHTGVENNGWWFYHGGDEGPYFNLSKSIVDGNLAEEQYPLGLPLFWAPVIKLTGAEDISGILKPIFIIQAFVLFCLSIILMALIADLIFKNRKIAILCAGLFTFYPYIFYLFFKGFGPYYESVGLTRGVMSFIALNWLQLVSDPLSLFLILLCFYLFFLYFKNKDHKLSLIILLGIVTGFSVLVRISNILLLPIITVALICVSKSCDRRILKRLWQKVKSTLVFGFFFGLTLIPQFIYNFLFFGNPLKTGYQQKGREDMLSFFSSERFIEVLTKANSFFPGFIFIILGAIVLLFFALRYFIRRDKITAFILFSWIFSYFFFYIFYSTGGIQARFFIPIIPPCVFIGVAVLFCIYKNVKSLWN